MQKESIYTAAEKTFSHSVPLHYGEKEQQPPIRHLTPVPLRCFIKHQHSVLHLKQKLQVTQEQKTFAWGYD